MNRMTLIVAFACGLFLCPGSSIAQPSCANSSLPSGIQLVGMSPAGVDARGEAVVIVRDCGNNPTANATVELQFGACCSGPVSDLRFPPAQSFPGMAWVLEPDAVASAITNEQGRAVFRIVGGAASSPGNPPGLTTACATVRADGMVLGTLRVGAYDLNSSGGVNAADQSLLLSTLFASPNGYRTRADYNGDGLINSADLAKILSVQFGAGSLTSGTAMACP